MKLIKLHAAESYELHGNNYIYNIYHCQKSDLYELNRDEMPMIYIASFKTLKDAITVAECIEQLSVKEEL